MNDPVLYEFGPLERRGVLLGLRWAQLVTAALIVMLGLVAMWSGVPFLAVLMGVAIGLVASIRRVRGRSLVEWVPLGLSFVAGAKRWRSSAPTAGVVGAGASVRPAPGAEMWPPELRGVQVVDHSYGEGSESPMVGVAKVDGGWVGVVRVETTSWALDERHLQESRLEQWASTLSKLARDSSPVTRLQWVERTVPDDRAALVRYLAEAREQLVPLQSSIFESYRTLIEGVDHVAVAHEVYLALRVEPGRQRARWKELGGGDEGACSMLLEELERLADDLHGQGLVVQGLLPPRQLAAYLRTAYDPASRETVRRSDLLPGSEGVGPDSAVPAASDEHWSRFQTLSGTHRTYWVEEWPRRPITAAEALMPLLLGTSQAARTVAVTFEPIPPDRAAREAERAVASDAADEDLRGRKGFRQTARRRRQADAALRREAELAAGYAEMRYSGWVTVTVEGTEGLDGACDNVEQAAQQAGLRLQACNGEQRGSFTHTLPLCRGLA